MDRAGILPDGGKIGGGLAIKQAELLKFAVAQRLHAGAAARHQRFQLLPVGFALLNPICGDHLCSPLIVWI